MGRIFTQTFGVVGGILERDGKILLMKEAGGKHEDAGKWNHPAGWIDVGEDILLAAEREVKEETGYSFTPTRLLGVYSLIKTKRSYGTAHALKLIFTGTFSESQTSQLSEDSAEVRWFLPDEIYAMSPEVLRDTDIKQMVRDYFSGKGFPLSVISQNIM
jgi:8-oxo-dGTP pyrophosphatase MutT (NUDIX family)